MRGSTSVGYDQFETRIATCSLRTSPDRLKANYSIDMWYLYSTDSHEHEFNSGPQNCNGLQAFRESHANNYSKLMRKVVQPNIPKLDYTNHE